MFVKCEIILSVEQRLALLPHSKMVLGLNPRGTFCGNSMFSPFYLWLPPTTGAVQGAIVDEAQ